MESPFHISFLNSFELELRELAKAARQKRRLWQLKIALAEVDALLTSQADRSGDPLFHYKGLQLEMRQVIRQSYWFLFGVHIEKRQVFLKRIKRIGDF